MKIQRTKEGTPGKRITEPQARADWMAKKAAGIVQRKPRIRKGRVLA